MDQGSAGWQREEIGKLFAELEAGCAPSALLRIRENLDKFPLFQADAGLREQWAAHLVRRASRCASLHEARAFWEAIPAIRGYGFSEALQAAHGEALGSWGLKAGQARDVVAVAEELARIPSFRDSASLQLEFARLASAATTLEHSSLTTRLVESVRALPLLREDERIEECYQRCRRNQERHASLKAVSSQVSAPGNWARGLAALALGGILLGGLGVGLSIKRDRPTSQSTPVASESRLLELAQTSFDAGDYNAASAYARSALQVEQDPDSRKQTLELLVEAHRRSGQVADVARYLKLLAPERREELLKGWWTRARQAKEQGQTKLAADEVSQLVGLVTLPMLSGDEAKELAGILEGDQRWLEAARVYEELGQLEQAVGLLEKAGETERLLVLYPKLGDAYRPRWMKLRRARALPRVKEAEELLLSKKEEAAVKARGVLKELESVEGSQSLQARCWTVLAKGAFHNENFKEAVQSAQMAVELEATAERKERLKSYRYRNRLTVTPEDLLEPDGFEFPPAVRSSQATTYLYVLHPPVYRSRTARANFEELTLQPPRDEFQVRSNHTLAQKPQRVQPKQPEKEYPNARPKNRWSSGRAHSSQIYYRGPSVPEQARELPASSFQGDTVHFEVVGYDTRRYRLDFSSGKLRRLQPGSYDEATRYPSNVNNPGLTWDSPGFYGTQRGRFVVHEIAYDSDGKVARFGADFLVKMESGSAVYGKVRLRSNYK